MRQGLRDTRESGPVGSLFIKGLRQVDVIAFWILAVIVAMSAIFVIGAKNPVHSVLWLITAFFTSAGLLVLIGAQKPE